MIQLKDFFVLRQPVYPLDRLVQFNQQLTTQSLDNLLRQYYQDPLLQQAIFAASPALYERFKRWLSGETLPEHEKLLITLHKYFIRMCSRPTPYGLFAGCSVGGFGEHTQFRGSTSGALRMHTRLDMDYLLAICQWLIGQPSIRQQLRLFPNSSLYPVGSSFRFIEQQEEQNRRHYFISVVEADQYLSVILKAAKNGASITQLATLLAELQVDAEEATSFIEQLIEGQLLVFDIEPTVTGGNYLERLTERIAELDDSADELESLRQLNAILEQSDQLTVYAQAQRWFQERNIHLASADVVQIDTFFDNPTLQLGERPAQLLQRNLERLLALNQPNVCPDLDEFKRRFHNRYEDEEVLLATALDGEFGVGYGTSSTLGVGYAPFIDDLTFGTAPSLQTTTWDWWQTLVMDKYARALHTQQKEIVLTDDDLTYISSKQPSLEPTPDSFYAFGTLLASSGKSLDEGDFLFNLMAYKGPSAINLMTRFGEGNDTLTQHIRECAAAEEAHHPDVIMAEIIHLPENRVGNILTRPTIRQYEIPYMGQSSVPPDFQIPLTDLMISVRNNQVVLRSKRLNQRIIPRLTNAHNFTQGLPIYRFLCDLQSQDANLNVAWNWGVLRTQAYLPRVRYRNIIISRATWQLRCSDLTPDNPLRLVAQLTAAGVPDQFVIAQGDNELFISMHTPASLELLVQEIRRAGRTKPGSIRLIEFLSMPDQCPLTHKKDNFTHELIIPFQNEKAQPLRGLRQSDVSLPQRKFSIGSEWFYLKIYTGEKTSDALLVETIYPLVKQLLRTQIIQEFFFIRYTDTDPHLRLRFRGNAHLEFYHHVVRAVEKALHSSVEAGIVHRVQVDTYQRELERYGMEHITTCETLFHYDSLSTLSFMVHTGNDFNENLRIGYAIRKIDQLLIGTGLSTESCRAILNSLKESFFHEFGGESELRHQLNDKYRSYRVLMDQALTGALFANNDLDSWEREQAELLRAMATALADSNKLFDIISSLIHMVVNRLFPSKQRAYELVLYHCLTKYYDRLYAIHQVS